MRLARRWEHERTAYPDEFVAGKRVTCSTCGAELEPTADTQPRTPCSECGGTGRSIAVEVAMELELAASASWVARSGNTPLARRHEIESALAAVEAAVEAGKTGEAQKAVKRALEAVHQLNDCLARGEWARMRWTPDDRGLWTAHIGARNAAHHTSATVVALHSGDRTDDRLRWDIDSAAIAGLRYKQQAGEYTTHLAGQAVVPSLRQIAALLARSIH